MCKVGGGGVERIKTCGGRKERDRLVSGRVGRAVGAQEIRRDMVEGYGKGEGAGVGDD